MKRSLKYLPTEKRCSLRQLVEVVRAKVKVALRIILYSGYARSMYAGCDQWIEYRELMNDSDIRIITEKRMGLQEYMTYVKVLKRVFLDKAWGIHIYSQLVKQSSAESNKIFEKSLYFYNDVRKEGRTFCDNGKCELSRHENPNCVEIADLVKEHDDPTCHPAIQFLGDIKSCQADDDNKMAFFLALSSRQKLLTRDFVSVFYPLRL